MPVKSGLNGPSLNDNRIVLHFDYDCFYASVFEAEKPALKSLPLAVQQKQIIVTCNYEARRQGLHKLQLIAEARRVCPDVIIVLGEDLSRFRAASKALYAFLTSFVWSKRSERLGFDEVSLDVTDMIDFNVALVNHNNLSASYFHLDSKDPTQGFEYDASAVYGNTYPEQPPDPVPEIATMRDSHSGSGPSVSRLRLIIASHLARYLRHRLEEEKGYTATVGVSVNKLLSKLVGSVKKPNFQTVLLPPYISGSGDGPGNVSRFIDAHEIGKIPGIGFKLAQKIRAYVLGRDAMVDEGLVYGGTKEHVSVRDVRLLPGAGPSLLEEVLGGPGFPKGIGVKIWGLIHGADDTEVAKAKTIPTQISIEDSYIRLDTIDEVRKELVILSTSLIKRFHLDLTDLAETTDERQWLAIPQTLRLSTRPRPPRSADGTRSRSFNRISRSGPMPTFVLSKDSAEALALRLANEALIPMFKKLHPEKSGWNLSLVNVAATNMQETASGDTSTTGRDIGQMFKRQKEVLKEWKVEDVDVPPERDSDRDMQVDEAVCGVEDAERPPFKEHEEVWPAKPTELIHAGSEDSIIASQSSHVDGEGWESEEEPDSGHLGEQCLVCGAVMPAFAYEAHSRYHMSIDD